MEELPTRLRFSTGQDIFTGNVTSDLTFSVSGGYSTATSRRICGSPLSLAPIL